MIKLTDPCIPSEVYEDIKKILQSGLLVHGKMVELFEKSVAACIGARWAIAVNSGTSALHLSLLALGVQKGDEVITSDFTFPATVNVIEAVGAKPVLIDINLATFNLNVDLIKSKITKKTKVIIPVHLFGQSADMEPILEMAKQFRVAVVEDAACAFGAKYKGRTCGTFGDLGCFSFHPKKIITTGEGGIVLTDNFSLAQTIRLLRNHGMTYKNGRVKFILPGLNNRLNEIQAALGIRQMKNLQKIIKKRRQIAKWYDASLAESPLVRIPSSPKYATHIYQAYVVLLNKKIKRDSVLKALKLKGIEAGIGTYSVHQIEYYKKKYRLVADLFKQSREALTQSVSLPIHPNLTKAEVSFVAKSLLSVLKKTHL
ncbi:MAG: hypothetical protein A2249_02530 [Candidatus Jacksonbacteria bacterium RIFOXYA2_FULL_44_7]|uniref:Glutamine--scyllo-inositol aminotransferase n=1 Tax=Candidatus Jacksonbacteria bacterium RIFCSPLOWO2_02_FULL_44_20 TaxID=1798460 RepID=A0A1G2A7G0_9BACT|nr:MAG: Glutamine-scyllo-inositol transaminase [Parcubacteria group bacterium GW2011_GWC2_44_17]KKT50061.1 MAG: Glutamine-scyllo-inositol transaminase [Parcubacteria group bacterium GW2011_GWF2_44_17]OGY69488.1 MAG: hypothetical protein A3C00_00300 [Candidatus Jacksonbacteria bacterium RIFCSPHIGHO2_02_FULL_44_25]OGY70326.1 MAG: hypothetical protein A3E05_01595 [Candidatus Jacksonbacteria bacterium RIFCSPHIGHO2_12_FULL_44_12]OGY72772.1 MAG: hypothetical protein A3H61_02360 [Candidatus Jacksonbac